MFLLTLRDLAHRWVRFVVVSVLGALVFALLFVMTGLVEQFNLEPADTVDAIGADGWLLPDGLSGPFTATATMSASTLDELQAAESSAVVAARTTIGGAVEEQEGVLLGVVPGQLGVPVVDEGRAIAASGEVMVDSSTGADVGDAVQLAGESFSVVGITTDTKLFAGLPLVTVSHDDSQRLAFGAGDVVSGAVVNGAVEAVPEGTQIVSADDVVAATLEPLEGAISSIDLVRALLWILAAIVIGAVVYLSALERQRDFAVLKAVGTPNRALLGSLAIQAVVVALVAVAVGAVIQLFLAPRFPLRVRLPASAYWQLPVLAIVVALVAGAVGMRKVASADPAAAFAGAGA
ncbi:MAG: ABC transporter permease [Actinomycetota bacterium]